MATSLPGATTGRPGHRVLPDRPFDLAALSAMDADVAFAIDEFDLGSAALAPLRPLSGRLLLHGGVLSLRGIQARTGQGSLGGDIALDGRGSVAAWTADLHGEGVQLERWIRQSQAPGRPPYVSGKLNGRAVLAGHGLSAAGILADLNGTLHAELRSGTVSHLAVEMAGLDLAHALGLVIRGDEPLAVRCAVADLQASAGVLRSTAIVLDTAASAIWIEGSLSLADETLDLRGVVSPKSFSPLTLRTPLRLRGSFAAPEMMFDRGLLAGTLASSVLLALLNPFAALALLVDAGDEVAARNAATRCQALARQGRVVVARGAR
jgi:uncharacterized protein involved in outer membrane biogenesis